MALNIIINKVSVAASFAAGATVATAVASGGTAPYVYSLATGGDKFAINSSTGVVTTIAAMDITNIASFSVTATDSTTGTALTGTSDVTYPPIQAAIRSKFDRTNVIYKITKDIDLGHGVLTIPEGCTLDFQGGSLRNGSIIGNNTAINAELIKIFENINLLGTYNVYNAFPEWFGAIPDGETDCSDSLELCIKYFNKILLQRGTYAISRAVPVRSFVSMIGNAYSINVADSILEVTCIRPLDNYSDDRSTLFYDMDYDKQEGYTNTAIQGISIENITFIPYSINNTKVINYCIRFNTVNNNTFIRKCNFRGPSLNGAEAFIELIGPSLIMNFIECGFYCNSTKHAVLSTSRSGNNFIKHINFVNCLGDIDEGETFVYINHYSQLYLNSINNYWEFYANSTNKGERCVFKIDIDITTYVSSDIKILFDSVSTSTNDYNIICKENVSVIARPTIDIKSVYCNHTYKLISSTNDILLDLVSPQYNGSKLSNYYINNGINNYQPYIYNKLNSKSVSDIPYLYESNLCIDNNNIPFIIGSNKKRVLDVNGRTFTGLRAGYTFPTMTDETEIPQKYRDYGSVFYKIGDALYVYYNGQFVNFFTGKSSGKVYGSTNSRPVLNSTYDIGYQYFDTTLKKPIWWNGSAWVDATGTTV